MKQKIKWMLPLGRFLAMVLMMLAIIRCTLAQDGKIINDGRVHKVQKKAPVEIESVSQPVLSLYKNQLVKVKGIIGDYASPDKSSYKLHTNDGSDVIVMGDYPDNGGNTTWLVTGRVGSDGTKLIINEISKERVKGSGGLPDPLLFVGGGLIVLAIIIMVAMLIRNKNEQQRLMMEEQIEEERRKAEMAQTEAEALRRKSERASNDGPGGTVMAGAARAESAPARQSHTIISVGSLDAVSGPHAGEKFTVAAGETRIGRTQDKDCKVVLEKDGEVSGYHGSVIMAMDGRVSYRDESTNGSLVNGKPVHHGQCEIKSGDQIEVGGTVLVLKLRVQPNQPVTTTPRFSANVSPSQESSRRAPTIGIEMSSDRGAAAPTMAGYGAEFVVTSGPDTGQTFAISRTTTTLGREDRDIVLSDLSISRRHATLTIHDQQFILTDDHSAHGTKVNGQKIGTEGQALSDGDLVVLGTGTTQLAFHCINAK